jgi:selenocysteine lyase/cysteine desulfurase
VLDRRSFLRTSTGVAAGLAMSSRFLEAMASPAPPLPAEPLFEQDEEAYWAQVRQQFLIPADEVYLNNGTVGSSPRPVLQAIFRGYEETERMDQRDPEDYPIWGYGPWNEFRDPLAMFVGCTRDEIALLRNSTEANSYIANGIDMQPGDEVLMSDQEHPSGEEPWKLRAKRYGVVVKRFQIPKPPHAPADILNRVNDAITPRTRVLFVSHISTVTGVVLPVKELCALARAKGIISALDGAHVTGMMRLNIHDLGCDMYASSPHKWLQAPKGSGYLYVRPEMQERLWSTIATAGWDDPSLKAERFQRIGSSNVPALYGLRAAIQFAELLGMERVERRHRKLADYILAEMQKRGAESWTSPDPALRCGIVTVNVPPIVRMELQNWLWKERRIRIRGGEPSKLRLSTPYYLLKADIDRFLTAFDEYKRLKQLT